MKTEASETARQLIELGDELFQHRGLLHRAARLIVTGGHDHYGEGKATSCWSCAGPVQQPARGRRRKYCTRCSPRKKAENG